MDNFKLPVLKTDNNILLCKTPCVTERWYQLNRIEIKNLCLESLYSLFWDRVSCGLGWSWTHFMPRRTLNSWSSCWDYRRVLPCPAAVIFNRVDLSISLNSLIFNDFLTTSSHELAKCNKWLSSSWHQPASTQHWACIITQLGSCGLSGWILPSL